MRTLVISDLHLGTRAGVDLLRRPQIRETLLESLAGVDRLVILGDGLELREASLRVATDVSAPFFADIGAALGKDKEIIFIAGNHDHGLVAGWIDGRLQTSPPGFLKFEHRIPPEDGSSIMRQLAENALPAKMSFAYPGVWLREDVYAFHGNYLDVHTPVPTFERLAAGAMARWVVSLPEQGATPDDYDAIMSPLYAWMHALAQRSGHAAVSGWAQSSARAWVALAGDGRRKHPIRSTFFGIGFAGLVKALNASGIGPIETNLSAASLRRGGLFGVTEVLKRLGMAPQYVIFGHTHRSGPWQFDNQAEWKTPTGTQLYNTGSWVYQPHFLAGQSSGSPYWPGTMILLEDEGPPKLKHLLAGVPARVLASRN